MNTDLIVLPRTRCGQLNGSESVLVEVFEPRSDLVNMIHGKVIYVLPAIGVCIVGPNSVCFCPYVDQRLWVSNPG